MSRTAAEATGGRHPGRALIEYLGRPDYTPLVQRELVHRLQVPGPERPAVRELIRRLLREGRIVKLRGGRLALAQRSSGIRGVLTRHRKGFGFVRPEDGGEDLFVPPRHLGDARSGDRVTVRLAQGRSGRSHAVVTGVVERGSNEVVGVFVRRGKGGFVQPFDPAVAEAIHIPAAFRHGAVPMHAVRVELLRPSEPRGSAEGKVVDVLGHLDEPGTDTLVVAHKYGLALEFAEETLAAAAALPSRLGPKEAARRERFEDPPPVTIDGETAQDFDDAIAVQELPQGGFRLFVHIADVAHFVAPGGALDREARRRGTSVYFPGRVLPMFPEKISNDLCSLRPGVDRAVQSVVVDFDAQGRPGTVRFADGVIRSAARLTYTQVADLFEGSTQRHGVPAKATPMLRVADRLRALLERRRHERGGLDFDLPEPQILLDVEGVMTGVTVEPRNRAHRMIEEFMIAANEAVARDLLGRGVPFVGREHDPPDPTKLEALARFVAGFGLDLGPLDGPVEPRRIQRMLERIEGRPEARIVSQVTLRSMKQARYAAHAGRHFGLASEAYCHFTSPIRRYPDLVVHRTLRATRLGRAAPDEESLASIAETSSDLERNAEAAERELLQWKKVAFIEGQVGEEFDGVVTGVARFGVFVQLIDNLVEGLIRVEELADERLEFDEGRLTLRGSSSGVAIRLGDSMKVRVARVDRVLQRVDLSPVRPVAPDRANRSSSSKAADRPPERTVRRRSRAPRGGRRR